MATPGDRRRQVRQLVLDAARARANDALTLKSEDCNKELFAPFSPSPVAVIDAVWAKIEGAQLSLTSNDLLVDLGCGDGRWLVSGVKRFNCSAFGVELDENLVKRAKIKCIERDWNTRLKWKWGRHADGYFQCQGGYCLRVRRVAVGYCGDAENPVNGGHQCLVDWGALC
ncbi:hypothetical protein AM588_10003357 [Phytophthora nicotianae]|uniref:Methyltransferase domain-containing protein n=1 Tax=Phytophthora nicotianae TaxID=4792 RepID=A0A0W8D6C4_PHYNI|nr:hypothetical protein AM588_10003357 [Phytophthora nicotianae]